MSGTALWVSGTLGVWNPSMRYVGAPALMTCGAMSLLAQLCLSTSYTQSTQLRAKRSARKKALDARKRVRASFADHDVYR